MGYESLLQILKDAREARREEAERAVNPTECPLCGMPLDYNEKRGMLGCSFCGYRVPGRK